MALTTKERTDLRKDLVQLGYHSEIIDDDTSKITLYLHKPMLNPSGEVVRPVGTAMTNLPAEKYFLKREGRQGMLGRPPGKDCTCKWCASSRIEVKDENITLAEGDKPVAAAKCPDCDFMDTAPTAAGASSRLRAHTKTHS